MIEIMKQDIYGITNAIRGMRNPMESWELSDTPKSGSRLNDWIGNKDKELMMKLAKAGPEHAKYRRMIVVYCDILAPLYWWKEFDTYKIGTIANSCSTMHKIHAHEFMLDMFSHEHLDDWALKILKDIIYVLNAYRELYLKGDKIKKEYWWQMIQLLPSSYNQKRTVMLNYEVLANQYRQRKNHKLDEWRDYCNWIERLPFSWIITEKDNELAMEPNDEEIKPVPSVGNWFTEEQINEVCSSREDKDCRHLTIKRVWKSNYDRLLDKYVQVFSDNFWCTHKDKSVSCDECKVCKNNTNINKGE